MPVEFLIDEERRCTTVIVRGSLTLEVARRAHKDLYAQDAYRSPMVSLWDLSEATLDPGPGEVLRLVEFIREHRGEKGVTRTAIVASRVVDFGISRMFEAHAAALPFEVKVFRKSDEARRWLGIQT